MIDRRLLENVQDEDSLKALLETPEDRGGLGWPVDPDFAFDEVPEIASGVKGDSSVRVSRLVPASTDVDRLIVLAEFDQPYVRRDLRELLASLRRFIHKHKKFEDFTGLGDTLFIVVGPAYEDTRFVLFEEQERRQPRIRSFGWSRANIGRTVLTHNLERLHWSDRDKWDSAWDVDALTDEFYGEFVQVFDAIKEATDHPEGEKARHSYVQQLLNRLLFISFIERMGWIKPPDDAGDPHDYLKWLWDRHQKLANPAAYYQSVLEVHHAPRSFNGVLGKLFFDGLDDDQKTGIYRGHPIYPLVGEVPYLNGGLFSEEVGLDVSGVEVRDSVFALLFSERTGLFRKFNFTVTESTPLDQEVAVDPEMLGKIFERIIVAEERHRTGTYYTPRPIVELMVNEALKSYLVERGLALEKAALLVDQNETKTPDRSIVFDQEDLQNTANWLSTVRAVDPACGSGAYLLMLLQRLFDLVDRVRVIEHRGGRGEHAQRALYKLKLNLLQSCVYGVDLSETAVRIARLRLWLSLVVENKGEKPEPLPNFRFMVVRGDSLASPVKPAQHALFFPHDDVEKYTQIKSKFFHPEEGEDRPSEGEMLQLRDKIATAFKHEFGMSKLWNLSEKPFDWEVDFAEVFDPATAAKLDREPGFDIVLANPPYVNSGELLRSVGKAYKEALVEAFPRTATGTADLLVYFMDRALELLRPGGQLAFITSNKWLRATYGLKLRSHIARTCQVRQIIDFGDLPVFQNVIAYPLITIAQKGAHSNMPLRFSQVKTVPQSNEDLSLVLEGASFTVSAGSLGVDGNWVFTPPQEQSELVRLFKRTQELSEYVTTKVFTGVSPGIASERPLDQGTFSNVKEGVFVITGEKRRELVAQDPKSDSVIKPLIVGRDVTRWNLTEEDRWLIYVKWDFPIEEYPAIHAHLLRFKDALSARNGVRSGSHPWFALERPRAESESDFRQTRIIYKIIQVQNWFALDESEAFFNKACFAILGRDLFLLGVLNSNAFQKEIERCCPQVQNGRQLLWDQFKRCRVPFASTIDRKRIEDLVAKIIEAGLGSTGESVVDMEGLLNRYVDFLYYGEGDAYEDAVVKQASEVRALLRRPAEDVTLEFKETLWHDVRLGAVHGDRVLDVSKAICAMLNRDGGTILIGVSDDAKIVGIQRDLTKLETPDKFQRKLQETFGVKLRPDPSDLVRVHFVPIDGETIARVDVKPDHSTMFTLNDKVYVRRDGESRELSAPDAAFWWSRRQKGEV